MNESDDWRENGRNRVIIGESDALARRAISAQFEEDPGFAVIAATGDLREMLELCLHYRPEIILVDSSPDFGGLGACRQLVASDPEARVLCLERDPQSERELDALWAGASGVVPRDGSLDGIVRACRQVLDGHLPHSDDAMRLLLKRMRSIPESGLGMRPVRSDLTSREWEVLDLLTHGFPTDVIAGKLFLSPATVRSHIKNLFRKLEVNSRAEAVERGLQLRWPET